MPQPRFVSVFFATVFLGCGTNPSAQEPDVDLETADARIDVAGDLPVDSEPDLDTDAPDAVVFVDASEDGVTPPHDVIDDRPDGGSCPEGPEYFYTSDDPNYCSDVGLSCEFPGDVFSNRCGCGCYFPPVAECVYDELGVLYQQVGRSPEECATLSFRCEEGVERVDDGCGCGCVYGPPLCLDPDASGVQYIGSSPDECEVIDFDCGGADYFNNPCGCGCVESVCEDHAARDYVARSAEECASIDYRCPEGWSSFADPACGCGCEVLACRVDKFLPPAGLAEPIQVGSACDFLVACSQFSLEEAGLSDAFSFVYPDAVCRNGLSSGCPIGTEAFCEVPLRSIGPEDIVSLCSVASESATNGILCSGDR